MYLPFEKLSPQARIWVYASNKPLQDAQKTYINAEIPDFLAQWTAHKQNLYASYQVFFDRFLVLAVEENMQGASGCSIDASVRWIQTLAQKIEVDFLCRDIFYLKTDNSFGQISPLKAKNAILNQEISKKTLIFNPLISKKIDLGTIWQQEAENSFLKKFWVSNNNF